MGYWDMIKLLGNKDVMVFLIQMLFKRWKKQFITKGGWKTPKSLFRIAIILWALYVFCKSKGWLPKKSLKGEHVFITGGGSGLGRYMAVEFAKQGCKVTITDVNLPGLDETKAIVAREVGLQAQIFSTKCDVSVISEVKHAADAARDAFGAVTILVNNAGIVQGKSFLEANEGMMKKVMEVNTHSHLWTIREFLPDMLKLNKGHIVSIASVAGVVGCPGLAEYSASKFGAFGIDECLRLEIKKMGKNIQTTCICPYYINTGMFDGVKSKWFLPILDQHWVVRRILNAVRQNEAVVLMPWNANLFFVLRGILPTFISDFLFKICGAFDQMNDFKGRQQKQALV